jgi:hypothetical protein
MAHLAQAPGRRASFVEEKHLAALTTLLRSEGRLAYRRPDHLEKITTTPTQESLVVDGSRLIITTGSDTPRVVELDGQPEIRALIDTIRGALSGNLALLRQLYDITGTGTASDWHIALHPRSPAIAQLVKDVQLTGGAEVRSIQTTAPNGDTDTLTITPAP